jgi:hypothetical protein
VTRRGDVDPPSLAVVVAGGVGVAAVVAFVAAVALGAQVSDWPPGARLAVAADEGPAGLAVLVPRCRSERVTRVELRLAGGDEALWRITAGKGSIDERYVVGAAAPLGFVTEVALRPPLPPAPLEVVAHLTRDGPADVVDWAVFDPRAVPPDGVLYQGHPVEPEVFQAGAAAAAACPESSRDLGLVTWLFGAAAAGVVAAYVAMVVRYWKSRSSGPRW